MRRWVMAVAAMVACSGAQAQGLNYTSRLIVEPGTYANVPVDKGPVDLQNTYLRTLVPVTQYGFTGGSFEGYVRISDFLAASGGISQSQLSSSLVMIANRIDRLQSRFSEGIALAGSINVLPPNEGDRFAVSFGGAGYDGAGAGSVAVSARVGDAIVYGALARGSTQSLVKGGVGWSFR